MKTAPFRNAFRPVLDSNVRFRNKRALPIVRISAVSTTFLSIWLDVRKGELLASLLSMDVARPDFETQKSRRRKIAGAAVVLCVLAFVTGVMRLKPAPPNVERSTIWTDTVKRGSMLRQVRGLGSLVPSPDAVRQIPAETEATVVRIRTLPGTQVGVNTVLVEMSNPQTEQAAVDARLQYEAALAEYQSTRVKLESDLMNQKAGAATVGADYAGAQRQADTDKALFDLGVISGLAYKSSKGKADELTTRNDLEMQRLEANQRAIESQMAQEQAKVDQMRTLAELKKKQLDALKVRAGIEGILVDLPLQVGQHVSPGTMLAKVVEPNHLMATLKISETQARDIQMEQVAAIDTHNGVVAGTVMRVDPAVQNGTVSVDVKLAPHLPKGARPDLSVDGTVDIERLDSILYVGRPAQGDEESTITLFKLSPDGKEAFRVTVRIGKASVNQVQVLDGLREGDTVILSDMSHWDNTDRVRLD